MTLSPPVTLGHLDAPSGQLLALDLDAAAAWCHDRAPEPPGAVIAALTQADDPLVDLYIDGADGADAGRQLDRGAHPRYLYDVPSSTLAAARARLAAITAEYGFDASLTVLAHRVTHLERVRQHIAGGDPARGIDLDGRWAGVVWDLPRRQPMTVTGQRRGKRGEHAGRWHALTIHVNPAADVARTELRGTLSVHDGLLLLADVHALGAWSATRSGDGKADVVVTGRDAKRLVRAAGAGRIDRQAWGWPDVSLHAALDHASRAHTVIADRSWEATVDVQPHSDRWRAQHAARTGRDGAGTLRVGGADVCVVEVGWEPGHYDVVADLDAAGGLARVRVVFDGPRTLSRLRRVRDAPDGLHGLAVMTTRAYERGVDLAYRDTPYSAEDSGWRLFAAGETPGSVDDTGNVMLVPLTEVIALEPSLRGRLQAPLGTAYERSEGVLRPARD